MAAYDVLRQTTYSPSSQRVIILIRKMPSKKPLCSALNVNAANNFIDHTAPPVKNLPAGVVRTLTT